MAGKKPIAVVRMGAVKASIWRHVREGGDSGSYVTYNTQLRLTYRKDGELNDTDTFSNPTELLLAAEVARKAAARIYELKAEDREAAKAETAS